MCKCATSLFISNMVFVSTCAICINSSFFGKSCRHFEAGLSFASKSQVWGGGGFKINILLMLQKTKDFPTYNCTQRTLSPLGEICHVDKGSGQSVCGQGTPEMSQRWFADRARCSSLQMVGQGQVRACLPRWSREE